MTIPFKGEFTPEMMGQKISGLSVTDDKLVRSAFLERKPEEREATIAEHREAKAYFHHLRDDYDIAVPDIDIVIAKEGNEPVIYDVVDRVKGQEMALVKNFPPEALPEIDAFYANLLTSFRNDTLLGRPIWMDLGSDQLVYGRRKNETRDRVYIVDIENILSDPDDEPARALTSAIMRIERSMSTAEKKFPPGTRLERTRKLLEEIRDAK